MKKLLKIVAVLLIVFCALLVALFVAMSILDSPTYAWRVVTMLWSDTGDIDRFAERAIEDGFITSVNDPVTKYIPEIAGLSLDQLTIRNLLRMDSGVRYRSERGRNPADCATANRRSVYARLR